MGKVDFIRVPLPAARMITAREEGEVVFMTDRLADGRRVVMGATGGRAERGGRDARGGGVGIVSKA